MNPLIHPRACGVYNTAPVAHGFKPVEQHHAYEYNGFDIQYVYLGSTTSEPDVAQKTSYLVMEFLQSRTVGPFGQD